ncbi:MAG: fused MFS/spermidine synthase [Alicyclobacillaceae bacterium]|nr:fused MFS/spermidine synthase [Alicyclobacillaceae bacterium]
MKTRIWMYAFVFVTGASVMTLEMAASRFAAPFFGTSLIVWANIIGLIMASLSLGYWFGGRLADRRPSWEVLFSTVAAAGVLASAVPWAGPWLFSQLSAGITGTPVHIILLSFFGIMILFAPPVFLLAMVSPFVLRLAGGGPEELGRTAGALYAWSTVGSIAGTFAAAFGFIPHLGTHLTLVLTSGLLVASAAAGLTRRRPGLWWTWLLLAVPLLTGLMGPKAVKPTTGLVFERETAYQYVQVLDLPDGSRALVFNEGGGVQSLRRPGDALLPRDYYSYAPLLPYLVADPGAPVRTLVIGAAAGTIPHLMDRYDRGDFPDLHLEGVEIDPVVAQLGPRYFGLNPDRVAVRVGDGRSFLAGSRDRWDIIVVDAYSQQIYIPFHLTTREFFSLAKAHLNPRGILAFNVNATSPDSRLLRSLLRTAGEVFPELEIIRVPDSYNYLVIASQSPIQTDRLELLARRRPDLSIVARSALEGRLPGRAGRSDGGILLTDDRAPVEFLTDSMIWEEARRQLR